MAVTIDEMQVEVKDAPTATTSTTTPNTESREEVKLNEALQVLQERRLRLKAD